MGIILDRLKTVILILLIILWVFIGKSWAESAELCEPQKITFKLKGDEFTVVDANDLDLEPDEILRALTYFKILDGQFPSDNKELKLEIFKKIAPNLYKRHIERRPKR